MKKVLIGCGIVVAVVVLVGVGGTIWLATSIKNQMPDSDRANALQAELIDAHGTPEEYLPPTDGAFLEAEQLDGYLRIRDQLDFSRASAAASLDDLTSQFGDEFDEKGFFGKAKTVFGSISGGMDLANRVVDYVATRDSLLLEAGIPLGEFTYVNSLALFAWLEWDPETEFQPESGDQEELEDLARDATRVADRLFRRQLENLADALADLETLTPAQEAQLATVDEVLAGRTGRGEFPLRGDLDDTTLALLTPHEYTVREFIPTTMGEAMVEAANYDATEDSDSSVNIEIR